MDLDTNVKKFKYSKLNKIICIILCLVTFMGSSWFGLLSALGLSDTSYNSEYERDNGWTTRYSFFSLMNNDLYFVSSELNGQKGIDYAVNAMKNERAKIIDNAYEKVLELRKQAEKNPNIDGYYEENNEGEEVYISTTSINYSGVSGTYNINYKLNDNITIYGYLDFTGETTKEQLEKSFDDNLENWVEGCLCSEYYSINRNTELSYYAKDSKGKTVSNRDNFNEKDVYNSEIYLISKQGKLEYKGIPDDMAKSLHSILLGDIDKFNKKSDFYFYLNTKDFIKPDVISTLRNVPDSYSQVYAFNELTSKARDNATKYIAGAIILLVISFVSGFSYFTITGKKSEDEKSTLIFYDYIPFEIGAGIIGGLFTGVCGIIYGVFVENLHYASFASVTGIQISMGLLFISWLLLFVFTASTIRYAMSEKKFYKHFVTYWVLLGLWQVVKFIYRLVKKLFNIVVIKNGKKIANSFKRTLSVFTYHPNKFKRNIILIAMLWLLANCMLIGLFLIGVYGAPFIAFLSIVLFLVGNILTLRKVCEYVKNLDKIIDASSRHQEPVVDFDTLDESLKMLVEGMRYTNTELQNAVAKAVKDERLRTELITNVSHDLKTPLTSIITYVDLLSKCDINDPKAQEYIKVLDEKGAKLKRLIEDLIEASKVTSGNVTVNLTTINLSELCLQSTVDAQLDFDKAGLDLIVKNCEKPPIVMADGAKAFRIIENLLSNARKYSAKASRVYVDVYTENSYGVFEIKNISAEPLDISPQELTERFVRGDKSRGQQEGNGLGLSIAKELATLQNGKLELAIDGDLFKAKVLFPLAK